jgi:hypothetical protein
MTYTPQAGDIGLTQIRGRVGELIRFGQWLNGDGFSKYEHAFMMINNRELVEAEPGGSIISELSRYNSYNVVYLRCPDELREPVAQAAAKLVKIPYSFLDYQSLVLHRLHINPPLLRNYIKNSGHMICSQLVDHGAMLGGWHLFQDQRWEGDVIPGDLYWLYSQQEFIRGQTS